MSNIDIGALVGRCLHHGAEVLQPGDAVGPIIVPASVYSLGTEDQSAGGQYGRWTNPTWSALEEALSILEDAETVIFPSGMAAIASIFFTQPKPGDRILLPSDGYYTTRALANSYLSPMGVSVETCPTAEYERKELSGFRLVWVETPSNPGLDVCDIRKITARSKECGALVVADNSTLTPIGQRPLDLEVDVVISSDTKALNGHSDVLFGHVASRNSDFIGKVRDWRKIAGAIPGPSLTNGPHPFARMRHAGFIASIGRGVASLLNESRVFASGHVIFAQSKGSQRNLVLWRFIRNRIWRGTVTHRPVFLRGRRTHGEFACGYHHHLGAIGAIAEHSAGRAPRRHRGRRGSCVSARHCERVDFAALNSLR